MSDTKRTLEDQGFDASSEAYFAWNVESETSLHHHVVRGTRHSIEALKVLLREAADAARLEERERIADLLGVEVAELAPVQSEEPKP